MRPAGPCTPAAGPKQRLKTCRRCSEPLPNDCHLWSEGLTFPVAGIGSMHMRCAAAHCKQAGITLEQATPICKHWTLRGYCIFQESCFYKHPPEARGQPKPPRLPPTPAELAARAQAWRAHNAVQRRRPGSKTCATGHRPGDEHRAASPVTVLLGSKQQQQQSSDAESGASAGKEASSLPDADALFEAPRWGAGSCAMPGGGARQRIKVRNRFRSSAFRRFLLDTFGRETLRAGSGVLDVAGGKGDLAFELVNLNGIPATLVEPRPPCLQQRLRWLQAGFYHHNTVLNAYVDVPKQAFVSGQAATLPAHLRMVASQAVSAALAAEAHASGPAGSSGLADMLSCSEAQGTEAAARAGAEDSPEGVRVEGAAAAGAQLLPLMQHAFQAARSLRWTCKGLQHEDAAASERGDLGDEADEPDESEPAPGETLSTEQLRESIDTWQRCSVVVGMHPDQATEAIVDFAQRTGKAFAVVPCCVYGSEFPRRRLPDGRPVKTYDDLVEYILAKDPAVRVAELPFEGRNKVLWVTSWTKSNT